ncbi:MULTISPECIES: hypothetical protein [unclassified Streptomyces]|uniref:hypothetical protein n=1 Tax=unclassified Streptomyces TaxID=2593676 RepID=UPI002E2E7061|nr:MULTISPECIES: hypothetical protein [unclassified Streptomyces]WUB85123.1 hypothetical protein OG812_00170 [Streptomyces sp. NBC_00566]
MNTRTTVAAILGATALALTACSGTDTADSPGNAKHAATPKATPSPEWSAAEKAAGIPPKPTGAKRAELLRALAAANPDTVKYEDKAIDAARNQCSAINGGAHKLEWSASQRFSYKDVTTSEAQGKQINEALKGLGFCKV